MSATALASDKLGTLSLTRVQENLFQNYKPADAFEAMLITQMAQTFVRLQDAYDVDRRYRAGRDLLVVITTKPAEFKAVQSYVRDCERAWNHAKENLEKAQRKRQREQTAASNVIRTQQRSAVPSDATRPQQPPVTAVPAVAAAAPRRE